MDRNKKFKLMGKIIEVNGECYADHFAEEEIDLTLELKGKIVRSVPLCPFFFNVIFPYLNTLQFGGTLPWQEDPNILIDACPDSEKVKIRIERIPVD